MTLVDAVVAELADRGETLGTAESLTAGLLCATFVNVAGASAVVRGGIVAYMTDVKESVLAIDADLIATHGTVSDEVAIQMAVAARSKLAASWALSTTGVAGPGPHEGHRAGTVHIAVAGSSGVKTRKLALNGTRDAVRRQTVDAAVSLLAGTLGIKD